MATKKNRHRTTFELPADLKQQTHSLILLHQDYPSLTALVVEAMEHYVAKHQAQDNGDTGQQKRKKK